MHTLPTYGNLQAIVQQQAAALMGKSTEPADKQTAVARAAGTYMAPEWGGTPKG